jgi:hypothetical protein
VENDSRAITEGTTNEIMINESITMVNLALIFKL